MIIACAFAPTFYEPFFKVLEGYSTSESPGGMSLGLGLGLGLGLRLGLEARGKWGM